MSAISRKILTKWENNRFGDLDKHELIELIKYYEKPDGIMEDYIPSIEEINVNDHIKFTCPICGDVIEQGEGFLSVEELAKEHIDYHYDEALTITSDLQELTPLQFGIEIDPRLNVDITKVKFIKYFIIKKDKSSENIYFIAKVNDGDPVSIKLMIIKSNHGCKKIYAMVS